MHKGIPVAAYTTSHREAQHMFYRPAPALGRPFGLPLDERLGFLQRRVDSFEYDLDGEAQGEL